MRALLLVAALTGCTDAQPQRNDDPCCSVGGHDAVQACLVSAHQRYLTDPFECGSYTCDSTAPDTEYMVCPLGSHFDAGVDGSP